MNPGPTLLESAAHTDLHPIGYTAIVKAIISEVLASARRRLSTAPFGPDTREATLLLGHILGWSEAQVIARQQEALNETQTNHFELTVNRRLTGEPVAYILGTKEFYGRPFQVDDRVLIPRPETEHLVEVVLDLPLPRWPSILDLGTGSGCIACTLALELPASRIVAGDLSVAALAVARSNLRLHGLTDRLQLLAGDLAKGLDLTPFDLVVSNPPYIGLEETASISSEILDFEPDTALFAGAAGDVLHHRLFREMIRLRQASWLVMEIGAGQQQLIENSAADSPFRLVEVRPDYAGYPRIAVLQHG